MEPRRRNKCRSSYCFLGVQTGNLIKGLRNYIYIYIFKLWIGIINLSICCRRRSSQDSSCCISCCLWISSNLNGALGTAGYLCWCTRRRMQYYMHCTCSLSLLEDESHCALYSTVRRTNTLPWEILLTALGNTPLGLAVCSLPARQPAFTSSSDLCNQPNIKKHEVNAALLLRGHWRLHTCFWSADSTWCTACIREGRMAAALQNMTSTINFWKQIRRFYLNDNMTCSTGVSGLCDASLQQQQAM